MDFFKHLTQYLQVEYPIKNEGLNELINLFKLKKLNKGDIILQSENFQTELFFLNCGIVREFFNYSEKETNLNFYTKPQFISDLFSFSNNKKSTKNLEALTDIELLYVDKKNFDKTLEKYDCGKAFFSITFQNIIKEKEIREYNRITKTPEENYKELLNNKPDWIKKIPVYHLASFLNIAPETLSRIRKRI